MISAIRPARGDVAGSELNVGDAAGGDHISAIKRGRRNQTPINKYNIERNVDQPPDGA
jgi:hypothetical protein